jgi:DNA primase
MNTTSILSRLQGVTRNGDGWKARCPAHDDKNPSLSISESADGKILIHCHAGCTPDAVCAALGVKLSDLCGGNEHAANKRNGSPGRIVATYPYHDKAGKVLFEVARYDPKDFRQRRPDATAPDGWTWNTKGIKKVLFRLPETLAAIASGEFIFVCEGEKDVLAMVQHGFSATTNPGGAGK